jgi:hypothetical protein
LLLSDDTARLLWDGKWSKCERECENNVRCSHLSCSPCTLYMPLLHSPSSPFLHLWSLSFHPSFLITLITLSFIHNPLLMKLSNAFWIDYLQNSFTINT